MTHQQILTRPHGHTPTRVLGSGMFEAQEQNGIDPEEHQACPICPTMADVLSLEIHREVVRAIG